MDRQSHLYFQTIYYIDQSGLHVSAFSVIHHKAQA
jgi:hypothetical protein